MENRHKILDLAFTQYGIKELPGEEANNPEILKYFKIINKDWVKTDETAWCSAGLNWVCATLGLPHSGELDARSWLEIGREVKIPKPGNIVILWRLSIDDWRGHVGCFIKEKGNNIWIYGGNQSNQWKTSIYPKVSNNYGLFQYREI